MDKGTTTIVLAAGGAFAAVAALDCLDDGHVTAGVALAVMAALGAAGLAAHLVLQHRGAR
ncbi:MULTISPECIES: hypothetical protein [Actinomyces]|uniref:Uncharacterized protein n=1 Tax=Actinomyces respiraculi TaxID=2744574 RepID=A0A7T0LKM7_9ACTO|nr:MULTISPECIES: hypothetical protein [Actinomyces]QPL05524.1 hypothetical protein ID810_00545 [Actinomyces respiraculi]